MRYWRLKDRDCSFIKLAEVTSISKDVSGKIILIVYQSGKAISYFYGPMKQESFDNEYSGLQSELEKVGQ